MRQHLIHKHKLDPDEKAELHTMVSFNCRICNFTTKSERKWASHFVCKNNVCVNRNQNELHLAVTAYRLLNEHVGLAKEPVRNVTANEAKNALYCKTCDETASSISKMHSHLLSQEHLDKSGEEFICPICRTRYCSDMDYFDHLGSKSHMTQKQLLMGIADTNTLLNGTNSTPATNKREASPKGAVQSKSKSRSPSSSRSRSRSRSESRRRTRSRSNLRVNSREKSLSRSRSREGSRLRTRSSSIDRSRSRTRSRNRQRTYSSHSRSQTRSSGRRSYSNGREPSRGRQNSYNYHRQGGGCRGRYNHQHHYNQRGGRGQYNHRGGCRNYSNRGNDRSHDRSYNNHHDTKNLPEHSSYCGLCRLQFPNVIQLDDHYRSTRHQEKMTDPRMSFKLKCYGN